MVKHGVVRGAARYATNSGNDGGGGEGRGGEMRGGERRGREGGGWRERESGGGPGGGEGSRRRRERRAESSGISSTALRKKCSIPFADLFSRTTPLQVWGARHAGVMRAAGGDGGGRGEVVGCEEVGWRTRLAGHTAWLRK